MRQIIRAPFFLPLATFVVILAVWEGSTHLFSIPTYILPAPSRIVGGFESIEIGRWVEHVWATLRVALIGYFISIVIALPIAIGLTRSEFLSRTLYPILVVIQSTPAWG